MKMQFKHSLAYLAVLCGTLGMACGAHADWSYDFQAPPPASFVMASGPPAETFSSNVGGGVLHFSDTTLPADGGAAVGFGLETSQVFTDVRVTGTLNPAGTTNNQLLLNARAQNLVGDLYAAGIVFADNPFGNKAGNLLIAKIVGGVPVEIVQSSDDSQGNQSPLADFATSYFVQWELVGNQQTARVFDVEGGTQLLIVNYTDTGVGGPAYVSGFAGVSSATAGNNVVVDGTFGPIRAMAILP